MENTETVFGSYSIENDKVPVPENLKSKDARADPVAKAAVFSANDVIDKAKIEDTSELSVIVVNREGCSSHVKRISDGVSKRAARQGFFARGGPQTLATYTALALNCHGAAYTLVGEREAVETALCSAMYLSEANNSQVILTVVVRQKSGGFRALSALISSENIANNSLIYDTVYSKLLTVFQQENES